MSDHTHSRLPPHSTGASQPSERFSARSPAQAGHSQCLISFGSNLGDRHDLIAEAARRINASSIIPSDGQLRTSRLFETPPIGGPDGQDPFLNAVGAFDTDASARDILALLQSLEIDLGRQRHQRWDARSIDLDVVLHGELVGGGTGLIVPHPRYTARQFVLKPACDVAAHYRDPRFGWTMETLSQHISAGNASMALVGGDLKTRELLCERLTQEHGVRTFAAHPLSEPMSVVGNAPAAIPKLPLAAIPKLPLAGTEDFSSVSGGKEGPGLPGMMDSQVASSAEVDSEAGEGGQPISDCGDDPWVAAYLPKLPTDGVHSVAGASEAPGQQMQLPHVPRLVARLQRTTEQTRWPAPHQMWPSGWGWPEYRLEVDDLSWAVSELASALDSMRCAVQPVTENGDWWS